MSSLPPTDPERRRRSLSQDELIALIVTFGSIGTILLWAFSQQRQGFELASLQDLLATSVASPLATTKPVTAPTDTSSRTVQASPLTPTTTVSSAIAPEQPQLPTISAAPFLAAPSSSPQASPTVSPQPSPNEPPTVTPLPPQFSDVPVGFWASRYIATLTKRNILTRSPDGNFRPDEPITRAEFATMLQKAFDEKPQRSTLKFRDLESGHWASKAIEQAVRSRFLSGYPGGVFRPNQQISVLQAQMSLVSGLKLQPQASPAQVLSRFQDTGEIPRYALPKIAAAVEAGLVIEYPNPQKLSPNHIATRADAAALIYQALKKEGKLTQ